MHKHSTHLFPFLHVLCDLGSIHNDRKHAFPAIFIFVFFGTVYLNTGNYAHKISVTMKLCTLAVHIKFGNLSISNQISTIPYNIHN